MSKKMDAFNNQDILRYLNGPYRQGNFEHKSAYTAALIDARISTGRDKDTGKIIRITGNWAGALVYMVLIDHIGNLFKKLNEPKLDKRSFIHTLKYFTELNKEEIYALYALRCSFAHEYFLFNIPKKINKENEEQKKERMLLTHNFSVTIDDNKPLITLPSIKWEGLFNEMSGRATIVNLKKLGDLVEEIHLTLIKLAKNNELEIISGKEYAMIANYVGYYV